MSSAIFLHPLVVVPSAIHSGHPDPQARRWGSLDLEASASSLVDAAAILVDSGFLVGLRDDDGVIQWWHASAVVEG